MPRPLPAQPALAPGWALATATATPVLKQDLWFSERGVRSPRESSQQWKLPAVFPPGGGVQAAGRQTGPGLTCVPWGWSSWRALPLQPGLGGGDPEGMEPTAFSQVPRLCRALEKVLSHPVEGSQEQGGGGKHRSTCTRSRQTRSASRRGKL